LEFRILGPLQVVDGDEPVEIAGTKRRALLALLVLRANEVVRSDWLIDRLWGERAPRNASAALHNHVSRLRKALGPDVLARREWGYVLRAQPESIDLNRFESLALAAESLSACERAEKLREALALWNGPPLADLVGEPALEGDIARLEELRLSTTERRIDADLEAGRNSELVPELEGLIAVSPLREHLRWQLILALYRAGRQAEALEVYRETRRVLAEELGLDPSPALRELERAILRQDPSLVVPAAAAASEELDDPPPRKRRRLFGIVALLALLGIAGAAAATAISHPHPRQAAAGVTTQPFRTIVTTVETHPTTKTVVQHESKKSHTTTAKPSAAPPLVVPQTAAHPHSHAARPTTTVVPHGVQRTHVTSRPHTTTTHTTTTTTTTTTAKTKPTPVRIADDFTSTTMDAARWWAGGWGSGSTAQQGNGQLVFGIPADPQFDSQYNVVGPNYSLNCHFVGDFDARVDYSLVDWPAGTAASVDFQAGTNEWTFIVSRSGDSYSSWPTGVSAPTSDTSGTLRLARSNGELKMYFRHAGRWQQVGRTFLRGDVRLQLDLEAHASSWQQTPVSASFANFVVTAPNDDCPPGDNPGG
jgi:DNA-binding SARP family transcriptional activator